MLCAAGHVFTSCTCCTQVVEPSPAQGNVLPTDHHWTGIAPAVPTASALPYATAYITVDHRPDNKAAGSQDTVVPSWTWSEATKIIFKIISYVVIVAATSGICSYVIGSSWLCRSVIAYIEMVLRIISCLVMLASVSGICLHACESIHFNGPANAWTRGRDFCLWTHSCVSKAWSVASRWLHDFCSWVSSSVSKAWSAASTWLHDYSSWIRFSVSEAWSVASRRLHSCYSSALADGQRMARAVSHKRTAVAAAAATALVNATKHCMGASKHCFQHCYGAFQAGISSSSSSWVKQTHNSICHTLICCFKGVRSSVAKGWSWTRSALMRIQLKCYCASMAARIQSATTQVGIRTLEGSNAVSFTTYQVWQAASGTWPRIKAATKAAAAAVKSSPAHLKIAAAYSIHQLQSAVKWIAASSTSAGSRVSSFCSATAENSYRTLLELHARVEMLCPGLAVMGPVTAFAMAWLVWMLFHVAQTLEAAGAMCPVLGVFALLCRVTGMGDPVTLLKTSLLTAPAVFVQLDLPESNRLLATAPADATDAQQGSGASHPPTGESSASEGASATSNFRSSEAAPVVQVCQPFAKCF